MSDLWETIDVVPNAGLRSAVTACWQVKCPANCIKIRLVAGLGLGCRLRFVGGCIYLRVLSLWLLIARLPNCARSRLVPMSIGDARRWRRQFGLPVIGVRESGVGSGRDVSDRPISVRESFMNGLCAGGAIARRTDKARSIGGIEVAKGKPERTYRSQNNQK